MHQSAISKPVDEFSGFSRFPAAHLAINGVNGVIRACCRPIARQNIDYFFFGGHINILPSHDAPFICWLPASGLLPASGPPLVSQRLHGHRTGYCLAIYPVYGGRRQPSLPTFWARTVFL